MKELIRDQRGTMSYLLALMFLPLLVLIYVNTTVTTQAVAVQNVDLQDVVERASRAAAYMVTKDSEAAGQPRINTAVAQQVFQDKVAAELGLDPSTLEPLPNSPVKTVSYVLIIYNVDSQYSSGGADLCKKYVFSNGNLDVADLYPSGASSTFDVTSNDIEMSGSGSTVTTLDRPGLLALLSASMSGTGETSPGIVSRWCSAKVISSTGI